MEEQPKEKIPLLEYITKDLLAKFGVGSHKPGSGSAVAFEGMIAAQLIHTVINLTRKPRHRSKYETWLQELSKIDDDVMTRVYPVLESDFQKDAILFDKVIKLRRARDIETDPERKSHLNAQSLQALIPATDILIEIADCCANLADCAIIIFDHAFQPAKGDSGVAMNCAVGALAGCLSIIDLNMSLFGCNQWTIETRAKVEVLRLDHKKLAEEVRNRMDAFAILSRQKSYKLSVLDLNSGRWEGVRLSESAIESLAEHAGNVLWEFRDLVWEQQTPTTRFEVLKPEVVIEKILRYQFGYAALGGYEESGQSFQVAGIIKKKNKSVVVSSELNDEVRNFTIAHELGHALLHDDLGDLHRDRPLDGSGYGGRDVKEIDANRFASSFLMPAKVLKDVFEEMFSTKVFKINRDTVFKVAGLGVAESDFRQRYSELRKLSRFIARYKGGTFQPLHKIFGVSAEAMAIRLETLGLVEY